MQRSTSRILTTHTGSLPRPGDLVAMLNAKELGEPYDKAAFATRVKRAIDEVVRSISPLRFANGSTTMERRGRWITTAERSNGSLHHYFLS